MRPSRVTAWRPRGKAMARRPLFNRVAPAAGRPPTRTACRANWPSPAWGKRARDVSCTSKSRFTESRSPFASTRPEFMPAQRGAQARGAVMRSSSCWSSASGGTPRGRARRPKTAGQKTGHRARARPGPFRPIRPIRPIRPRSAVREGQQQQQCAGQQGLQGAQDARKPWPRQDQFHVFAALHGTRPGEAGGLPTPGRFSRAGLHLGRRVIEPFAWRFIHSTGTADIPPFVPATGRFARAPAEPRKRAGC